MSVSGGGPRQEGCHVTDATKSHTNIYYMYANTCQCVITCKTQVVRFPLLYQHCERVPLREVAMFAPADTPLPDLIEHIVNSIILNAGL